MQNSPDTIRQSKAYRFGTIPREAHRSQLMESSDLSFAITSAARSRAGLRCRRAHGGTGHLRLLNCTNSQSATTYQMRSFALEIIGPWYRCCGPLTRCVQTIIAVVWHPHNTKVLAILTCNCLACECLL